MTNINQLNPETTNTLLLDRPNAYLSPVDQIQHYIIDSPTNLKTFISLNSFTPEELGIFLSPEYITPLDKERSLLVWILSTSIPDNNMDIKCLISNCNCLIPKKIH